MLTYHWCTSYGKCFFMATFRSPSFQTSAQLHQPNCFVLVFWNKMDHLQQIQMSHDRITEFLGNFGCDAPFLFLVVLCWAYFISMGRTKHVCSSFRRLVKVVLGSQVVRALLQMSSVVVLCMFCVKVMCGGLWLKCELVMFCFVVFTLCDVLQLTG